MNGPLRAPDLLPDEPAPALDTLLYAEQFRLTRDGLVNTTAYLVSSIAGMVIVPVLFAGLTRESYGIWIAALAVQYSSAFLTGGLGRGIAREVAMTSSKGRNDFVILSSFGYVLFGLVGAIVIASAGLPLSNGLRISSENLSTAHLVFCLVAIGFIGDQLQSLGLEIFTGLRRFVAINIINTSFVLIRTFGFILLLKLGGGLLALAAFHAFVCLAAGATAYVASLRRAPEFRPRPVRFHWNEVRGQFGFSIASQLTAGATSVLWRSAPFLLGFMRGASAIVPYELGGKFPMSVSSISWQAADVLFPAASEYHDEQQQEKTRQLLEVGTRGVLVFALPLCLALIIFAPMLLANWVHGSASDAVWVLRLTCVAVLLDSAATTSIQVTWGCGNIRAASQITFLSAIIGVLSAFALIPTFAAPGAAGGLAFGVAVSSALFILAAARSAALSPIRIIAPAVSTLFIPAIAEIAVLLTCVLLHHQAGWPFLIFSIVVGLAAFAVPFYALSATPIEKRIITGAFVSLPKGLYTFYSSLRRTLERVPPLRTAINYVVEIKNTLVDSSERDRKSVERLYSEKEDPFGFNRELEQFRFQQAIHHVQSAANGGRFPHALEIGCAEGMFTRMLAPYCDSLLAVDLSPIALNRAQRTCAGLTNIHFTEWDVRKDPITGQFDLIVATGVLEYILRPSTLRDAKERITAALKPGGYLLLGNTETGHQIEKTWIGRKLLRGTVVNDFFTSDQRYQLIDSSFDQCVCPFGHVLLKKRS